jgi:phytoene dehydrogenase-like protein
MRSASALRDHHVVVVGAGVGGLVSALLLASRGLRVTLVERAATPGGKMRRVIAGGQPIDSGPTVFTMRWIFDQIFAAAGTRAEDELSLTPLSVLARHHWPQGGDAGADVASLDLFADRARSAEAIGAFSGAAEAQRFLRFCDEAQRIYQTLEGPLHPLRQAELPADGGRPRTPRPAAARRAWSVRLTVAHAGAPLSRSASAAAVWPLCDLLRRLALGGAGHADAGGAGGNGWRVDGGRRHA